MSSNATVNTTYIKAGIAGASAVVLDSVLYGNQNMSASLYLGVATFAGVLGGGYINSMLPVILPSDSSPNPLYLGAAVQSRIVEVIGGYGAVTAVERYVPSLARNDTMMGKVGLVAISAVIGEVVNDYISAQPIAVFA